MGPVLQLNNLSCERDDRVLFEQLSLTVSSGDIIHFKGPNGAGKTTLLRHLVGLGQVVLGDVLWRDDLLESQNRLDGRFFWYLAHRPAVTLMQSPLENLSFCVALLQPFSHNRQVSQGQLVSQDQPISEDQLWQALETAGLRGYEDVPAYQLSAGQQRRIALARLYLDMPSVKLWLLDEPFTALDAQAVAQLETAIDSFSKQGGTVLMTSHHGLTDIPVRDVWIGQEPS